MDRPSSVASLWSSGTGWALNIFCISKNKPGDSGDVYKNNKVNQSDVLKFHNEAVVIIQGILSLDQEHVWEAFWHESVFFIKIKRKWETESAFECQIWGKLHKFKKKQKGRKKACKLLKSQQFKQSEKMLKHTHLFSKYTFHR